MSTRRSAEGDGSTLHNVKGRLKRFLGWMTADRRVEAEGEAEARTGDRPSASTVDAVEREVKQDYDEAYDPHREP